MNHKRDNYVKNDVYIISKDTVFARMLELELADAGICAVRSEILSVASVRGALLVADADTLRDAGEFYRGGDLIEIGFSDTSSIDGAVYFKRPFPVDSFVSAVKDMLSKESEDNEKALSSEGEAVSEKGLTYDKDKKQFFYYGEHIALTETEAALLTLLYERRGETVSRETILQKVWGREDEGDAKTNLTDVYIRYLREKLDDRFSIKLIISVRGKGYMLKQ